MPGVIPDEQPLGYALSGSGAAVEDAPAPRAAALDLPQRVGPNALVRWAFYLSAFAIPFTRLYAPGTGERFGVMRGVQLLLLCAVVSQPRICLRFVPAALLWFVAYCVVRVASGLWLAPELWATWWPTTFDWLQLSLPWLWIMFNVLQFPGLGRRGLWALVAGCSLCALLHIMGVGVSAVDNSLDEVRTTVFGENANFVGATYAVAVIALVGFGMFKEVKLSRRLLFFGLIALVGVGMAKTGSRTALFLVAVGTIVLLLQAEAFSSRVRRYSSLLLIGAILAGVLWQVPTVIQRFQDLDPHNIGHNDPRARMAPVLWEMFLRSPIYGSGPEQYTFELTRRAMPYLVREQRTIVAHNLALLLLVETGVIGFLICSAGLWAALAAAWRARLKPCGFLPLALFLPLFLCAVFMGNPASQHVFWFALAYALAGTA